MRYGLNCALPLANSYIDSIVGKRTFAFKTLVYFTDFRVLSLVFLTHSIKTQSLSSGRNCVKS